MRQAESRRERKRPRRFVVVGRYFRTRRTDRGADIEDTVGWESDRERSALTGERRTITAVRKGASSPTQLREENEIQALLVDFKFEEYRIRSTRLNGIYVAS